MATPPQGPKNDVGEALPGHSRPLLRLAKVTQKRGFPRRFPGGFPTVLPVVSRWLSSGFTGSFPAVRRPLSSGFAGSFPTVFQRFSNGFPAVLPAVFSASSTAVGQRFPGNTLPLDQPPAGSGIPLHPKKP